MTIAEELRQEGERRGMQLGKEEGLQEGEHSATLKIAHQLIVNGVELGMVKLATSLMDEELDILSRQ